MLCVCVFSCELCALLDVFVLLDMDDFVHINQNSCYDCLQPVEATDDAFWDQFWADSTTTVQDVFALVPAAEIRAVREESPSNLATLCYKVIPASKLH